MHGIKLPPGQTVVYSIFGVQCSKEGPSTAQRALIDEFDRLLAPSVNHVDKVIEDGWPPAQGKSHIWLGYWAKKDDYLAWWNQDSVQQFWKSLPLDAGMFREILKLPVSHIHFRTTLDKVDGLRHLVDPNDSISLNNKTGYWGCYRHTTPEMVTNPENRFNTSMEKLPTAPRLSAEPKTKAGRVKVTKVPDNLLFAVEGQDHSAMGPKERDYWFETFDKTNQKWTDGLFASTSEQGVMDTRICYYPDSGYMEDANGNKAPGALGYNRKVQLLYFADMSAMQRIGMQNKEHVQLRKNFMKAYGPEGEMADGKFYLWVETNLLPADGVECEYVGCFEGTGLSKYGDHEAFTVETTKCCE